MSIQEHLNKIRNAIYGREVRESIAKGIETVYDDASENGNANMEVKIARGTNPNLNTRLNKMDETGRQTNAKLEQNTEQLARTYREATRKKDLEDLTPRALAAIEGGEGTTFNLLSIPQDRSVTERKTTFMDVMSEQTETVNLIPDVLGELGIYYEPSTGLPITNDYTGSYKATGKITKGDFSTIKSFGVKSWIFYNSDNSRISSQEMTEDVITEVAFPPDTAYVIGNVRDMYFPLDDPDRSSYPLGVATANVVTTSKKYNIKDLIINDENLSTELKAVIDNGTPGEYAGGYAGKIVVNLGDSIVSSTNPSISDVIADELGSTTINGGFGGGMMCPHPNAEFAKFSMTAVADAIATGNWSIQENATGVPAGFKNTVARLKAVDWTQIYCVVISYGTNDWLNSNPLDNSSDKYDKSSYLGALRYSVRKLLQAYPNLKILVTAPIFRSTNDRTENSTNWKNGNGLLMSGYVEGLNRVGKELFIPIADTFFGLGLNAWNESFYFPANDGTHPNAIGRQLLGQKIANTIRYVY